MVYKILSGVVVEFGLDEIGIYILRKIYGFYMYM